MMNLMGKIYCCKVRVIGGSCKEEGEARLKIPFRTLGIIIDVNFYVMNREYVIQSLSNLNDTI